MPCGIRKKRNDIGGEYVKKMVEFHKCENKSDVYDVFC